QTETEATGAPQKHHYTLNQQVGSITRLYANNLYEFYSRPTDIRAAILSIIHAFHFCHPA
ncbi:hypothetical protein, partial [Klebsiella variicola]|uniref:hypothetical protein n=1 Tax=Klebsiella variicola TaxID=244366 RepID=UPI001C63E75F